MSFEDRIPEHIKTVEENRKKLYQELGRIDWGSGGHDCDCDYCDREGEGASDPEPDAEKKEAKIKADIAAADHTIASLKAHAAVHKIKLEDEKK